MEKKDYAHVWSEKEEQRRRKRLQFEIIQRETHAKKPRSFKEAKDLSDMLFHYYRQVEKFAHGSGMCTTQCNCARLAQFSMDMLYSQIQKERGEAVKEESDGDVQKASDGGVKKDRPWAIKSGMPEPPHAMRAHMQ